VVVAFTFIALKGELDLRRIGRFCDAILGAFMITLGCYGIVSAVNMYREKSSKRDSDLSSAQYPLKKSLSSEALIPTSSPRDNDDLGSDEESGLIKSNKDKSTKSNPDCITDFEFHEEHVDCACCPMINMRDPMTQRLLSFSIGILHGVAGPGAILGVLPAVEMQSVKAASIYLGSFIIASTISMGAFAALYGEATKRLGSTAESVELILRVFSSSLSVVVGVLWLVLSILGKLEKFFH
jgi:hypothetical protein